MTAVNPEGRISPGDAGLWNDEQGAVLAKIAAGIAAQSAGPGIRLAHARRKASANRPWKGDDHIPAGDPRDEETVGNAIVARKFKDLGVDQLDLGMGFATLDVHIPWRKAAFMRPTAERFHKKIDLPLSSSWGFDTPEIAESAIAQGPLDLAMVGKAHLANPHRPYYAARKLGVDKASWTLPAPYAHWLKRYAVGS